MALRHQPMNWRDSIWVQTRSRSRCSRCVKAMQRLFPIQRTRVTRVTRDVLDITTVPNPVCIFELPVMTTGVLCLVFLFMFFTVICFLKTLNQLNQLLQKMINCFEALKTTGWQHPLPTKNQNVNTNKQNCLRYTTEYQPKHEHFYL